LRAREDEADCVRAAVEGWVLGSYTFQKYKSKPNGDKPKSKVSTVTISGITLAERAVGEAVRLGLAVAASTNFPRDLIAEPAGVMTPTRLSLEARRVAKENGLTCTVMDRAQMEKNGMGALLGVAQGANEPPKFIIMKYAAPRAKKTVALVGKGITF